jgi:hypothetical protein
VEPVGIVACRLPQGGSLALGAADGGGAMTKGLAGPVVPRTPRFEADLVEMVRKRREVVIRLSFAEPATGFVTGLDEQYIQICRTDSQQLSLIRLDAVLSIEENGRSMWDLERDPRIGEEEVRRIHEQSDHFVNVATRAWSAARARRRSRSSPPPR